MPFACKLDSDLVKQLQERAAEHEGGMSEALADLLVKAGLERKASGLSECDESARMNRVGLKAI